MRRVSREWVEAVGAAWGTGRPSPDTMRWPSDEKSNALAPPVSFISIVMGSFDGEYMMSGWKWTPLLQRRQTDDHFVCDVLLMHECFQKRIV